MRSANPLIVQNLSARCNGAIPLLKNMSYERRCVEGGDSKKVPDPISSALKVVPNAEVYLYKVDFKLSEFKK